MHCRALAVALVVASIGSGAQAATYSNTLEGTVDVCAPDCHLAGPWFADLTVTTDEDGDGVFSGAQLQSISVDGYGYPGPGVFLLDFDSNGPGVMLDGSAPGWPNVTILDGQISDIEAIYTDDGLQWDFERGEVTWSTFSDSIVASAAIGAVPEASSNAMMLLGLAALALLRRSRRKA